MKYHKGDFDGHCSIFYYTAAKSDLAHIFLSFQIFKETPMSSIHIFHALAINLSIIE